MSDTQEIRSIDCGPVVAIDFFTAPFPKCYGAALVVVMLLFTPWIITLLLFVF